MMSDVKYSVWLSTKCTPGTKSNHLLLSAFSFDSQGIYNADEEQFSSINGISKEFIESLCNKDMADTEKILDYCTRHNVGLLPFDSEYYPKRLRRIQSFPILLYYKGTLPDIDNFACIAAVGTRRTTEYGRRNAYSVSRDLALSGAIVVSGMAAGIDTMCHRGALDAGGHTIAVLGCGIDVVYPRSNADLMQEIAQKGTIFTEYAPGTEPAGFNFPKRNRIISGLCVGTFVVEADIKSGALLTAGYAIEQGRDIFALPSNVGELNSLGTNKLIKDGAKIITNALDILDEYEYIYPQTIHTERLYYPSSSIQIISRPKLKVAAGTDLSREKNNKTQYEKNIKTEIKEEAKKPTELPDGLSENEIAVLKAMPDNRGVTSDEISRNSLSISATLVALTTLEIKRIVTALPGGTYIKNI